MPDYDKLEQELRKDCEELSKDFVNQYNENYISAGGAKLDAFIYEMQQEFNNTAVKFLQQRDLLHNKEAKKRTLNITKHYAKNCVEHFSKVTG